MPERGSVAVADRGYCYADMLRDWNSVGICFVTRLKQGINADV